MKKLDPDPHRKFGALEAQKGAVEGRGRSQWRPRDLKWSPRGSVDQWLHIRITLTRSRIRNEVKCWIRIRTEVKSWIRICIKMMKIPNPGINYYLVSKVHIFFLR
jgi:hypothetical protein